MGLMLSLLVTCVGVLETLACWRHFRASYLPLPFDAKYAAGSSPEDSASVRSQRAHCCSDESPSKYGPIPTISEHRRKLPSIRNEGDADAVGCGGREREGHCDDVSGSNELVLDTLPTIQELAQEPEEDQEELAAINNKRDSFEELQLHENNFSTYDVGKNGGQGSSLNYNRIRRALDENDNISDDWATGELTLHAEDAVRVSSQKANPLELHLNASTGEDDVEPQEFTAIGSSPTDTVDCAFTGKEISSARNETEDIASCETLSTVTRNSDVLLAALEERCSKGTSHIKGFSSNVEDKSENCREDCENQRKESRAAECQAWAEADALFHKRSPSRSPHHSPHRSSPARKLPKNVDISWPSFTPQHLFKRPSGTTSSGLAHLWAPGGDKRRASSGDVSSDLAVALDGKAFRSSSLGPSRSYSIEPAETGSDCPDPWQCDSLQDGESFDYEKTPPDLTDEEEQVESAGVESKIRTFYERGRSTKRSSRPLRRRDEKNSHTSLEQDIPYLDTSTKDCHSVTESKSTQQTRGVANDSTTAEETSPTPAASVTQSLAQINSLQESSPQASEEVINNCDTSVRAEESDPLTRPNLSTPSGAEQLVTNSMDRDAERREEIFAEEKSEPQKKKRRPVRISSFEREDSEKAQRKSRKSTATEECSDDPSAVSQSDDTSSSQPGQPFWVRTQPESRESRHNATATLSPGVL